MSGRFTTVTLGCKVNQYESEALACRLVHRGWCRTDGPPVDLCLINTCTVTGRAAMQSRQAIRRAKRQGAGRIVVTGCYAQVEPEALTAMNEVDLVVGHSEKHRIPDLVDELETRDGGPAAAVVAPRSSGWSFDPICHAVVAGRTRPLLKIQDGCDAFCTYCIVPYARGRSRSMPVEDVLGRVSALGAAGHREVVLTGIHLGRYGKDLSPATTLADLLRRIDAAGDIARFRVSSVEPQEFDAALIAALTKSPGCCRHFHLPLQSGDDEILRRMGRPYTGAEVSDLVVTLTRAVPAAALGLDVLVGFPGETEAAFEHTYQRVAQLPLAYLHVFPFSPRIGTPAARMSDPVPDGVITRRCARLRRLGQRKRLDFYRRFVGQDATAVVESRRDPQTGRLKIVTDNYLPVTFEGPDALMETLITVRIDGLDAQGKLVGRRLD
ncbi:MAG: tRNA (N(6)-L-threonylcarbamoyladenosine(37)-C(2))-methylthiotransferase MtaB [Desulfobacterales bacterium]|jgi:threonylcarbamoyladenosine tRNA methylthiotransferase MtaB|nr:tRNA (N(6)-L-threonylcarbamoyladenosine(37)-C(2))-methylthiotransferase MtaB [Desulfobacteraceae bacterium]MDD3991897.1 tRNA (N(6)-L-threonylcarbamoyladenosine(37)-C(2))-methylthiotransferase MtaB [Desulfobacteraceae bacterium]MDY0312590.1 tRNA (N(6)-L-threonylcarbamoyladenosine(37)-C(2))-methylthiotransferase MtaB [Desulfobacterales bacterium]